MMPMEYRPTAAPSASRAGATELLERVGLATAWIMIPGSFRAGSNSAWPSPAR